MLPLIPPLEPEEFDKLRTFGLRWLAKKNGKKPTEAEWAYASKFWKPACIWLYNYFGGVCNYSCLWISRATGSRTIEHFTSRDNDPRLAFEWSNFRLVCGILNGYKSNYNDVADPFSIGSEWFHIDFKTLKLCPGNALNQEQRDLCVSTIARLKLNEEEMIQARFHWLSEYCDSDPLSFEKLRRYAPHIAFELERQGLKNSICSTFHG